MNTEKELKELPEAVLKLTFMGGLGVCAPGSSTSYLSPNTVEKLFQEYLASYRKHRGDILEVLIEAESSSTMLEAMLEIQKTKAE